MCGRFAAGLYFSPAEKIDEVQIGDRYYYLYANDHQYALHGAQKTAGIFYITTGGSTHNDYADADEAFQIDGLSDGKNQLFVIHRSQPEIVKVEMDPGKGRPVIVFDQWEHDFQSRSSNWKTLKRRHGREPTGPMMRRETLLRNRSIRDPLQQKKSRETRSTL